MTNTRTLYLTESTFDFSQIDPESKLITDYQPNLMPGVYHTSLGDLSVDRIIKIASQFDYVKMELAGFDTTSSVYRETATLYRYLNQNRPNRFDKETFIDHPAITQRDPTPTLWVFGCSHSHGVGLRPNEKNYGQLLAEQLDLPLKQITKPGSSLHWSYRHLFNAPIQEHDTVIWQLTTPYRMSRFNGKQVDEIVFGSSLDKKLIDSVTDEQMYFNQISLLNTGTKFLQALNCKFAITSITDFGAHRDYVSEYTKYPQYCSNHGLHVDYGTDRLHAGPLSHKAIAQRLYNHIQLQDE